MTRRVMIRLSDGKPRRFPYSRALQLARLARIAGMSLWWYLELGKDREQNKLKK